MITIFDGDGTLIEESLDVFGVGIEEWIDDVHHIGGDLEMLHAHSRSDDGFDVMQFDYLGIRRRVEITNEQGARPWARRLHH